MRIPTVVWVACLWIAALALMMVGLHWYVSLLPENENVRLGFKPLLAVLPMGTGIFIGAWSSLSLGRRLGAIHGRLSPPSPATGRPCSIQGIGQRHIQGSDGEFM